MIIYCVCLCLFLLGKGLAAGILMLFVASAVDSEDRSKVPPSENLPGVPQSTYVKR